MTRARRQSAADTRSVLLDAAEAFVRAEGLQLEISNISLEHLIRTADVPRSTVFRIWPNRAAFISDVVERLFEGPDGTRDSGFDEETLHMISAVLSRSDDALSTAHGRGQVLLEATRVAAVRNVDARRHSLAWRAYRSAAASVRSGGGDEELAATMREIEERFLSRMEEVYPPLAAAFGRRIRPGIRPRDIAVCSASIVEGIVEREAEMPALSEPRRVALADVGEQEWHVAAIALWGVFTAFTEELPPEPQ